MYLIIKPKKPVQNEDDEMLAILAEQSKPREELEDWQLELMDEIDDFDKENRPMNVSKPIQKPPKTPQPPAAKKRKSCFFSSDEEITVIDTKPKKLTKKKIISDSDSSPDKVESKPKPVRKPNKNFLDSSSSTVTNLTQKSLPDDDPDEELFGFFKPDPVSLENDIVCLDSD